jgi:uncharacterized RDD family membrane protein YckC
MLADDAAFCGSCGTPAGRTAVAVPPAFPAAQSYPRAAIASPYADPAGLAISRGFNYAGFWLRLVAHLIDSLIIGAAALLICIPLIFLTGLAANFEAMSHTHGQPNPAAVGGFIMLILVFAAVAVVAQWLYFAYTESGEKQATWGKQAMGVYVTDLVGNPVTFGRASGRFFSKIVSGMIPLGIGYIMAGFTERKQALHDMIASCLVLRR